MDGSLFKVKSFFACQFHALRKMILGNQDNQNNPNDALYNYENDFFVQSLAQCRSWDASGGKSNASFCMTLDDRFIVKSVTAHEFDMFIDVAGLYFQHMARQNSALIQLLGAYRVKTSIKADTLHGNKQSSIVEASGARDIKSAKIPRKANRSSTVWIVVMGNAFYGCQMAKLNVFDLKGKIRQFSKEKCMAMVASAQMRRQQLLNAWHEWRTGLQIDPHPPSMDTISLIPVRLDGDLMDITRGLPVPLQEKGKETMHKLIESDGDFFLVGEAVDYSLLAGIDVERNCIVMGVVDYMHSYDILKRIEANVKNMIGEATIRPPPIYYERFLKGLDKYFCTVPMGGL